MVLTLWMDKVIEERENVQKQFTELRSFIDNFKPLAEIEHKAREKLLNFLNHAYDCHLHTLHENRTKVIIIYFIFYLNSYIQRN